MVAVTTDPSAGARGLDPRLAATAPWLAEAMTLLSTRDEVGALDSRGALRLLDAIDRRVPFDLPWCGIFVAHCLRTALPEVELPWFYPRGRSWLGWGNEVEPQAGAILVFWHVHRRSPLGHVCFQLGADADGFEVIGGNQHDRIAIERRPRERLLGARWPEGVPQPAAGHAEFG